MKCFHHCDLDGHCSGAIVKKFYPECDLYEIDYDIKFPMDSIKKGEVIFLVDFSLDPEMMRELDNRAQLIHIDHHAGALDLIKKEGLKFKGLQVAEGFAGCDLTWKYLAKGIPTPRVVFLLGRYDIWDHEADEDVLPFQYGMQALATLPKDNMDLWNSLLNEDPQEGLFNRTRNGVDSIVERGGIIQTWVDQYNRNFSIDNSFTLEFEGYTWIACNSVGGGSDMVRESFKSDQHDGSLVFGYKGRSKRWKVALYTDPDMSLDCSIVAQKYGGNGHKSAAGFTTEHLPFKLLVTKQEEVNR